MLIFFILKKTDPEISRSEFLYMYDTLHFALIYAGNEGVKPELSKLKRSFCNRRIIDKP